MIILHNNYIFLPKDKGKNVSPTPEETGAVIYLRTEKKVFSYIKSIFGEPVSKDTSDKVFKIIYIYEIKIDGIMHNVGFTVHNITHYSYLDVCVSGKTSKQVVNALEYIQNKIIGSGIEDNYIMIVSYDSISEYYCNKAYPKLNKLERNLRQLLFNTYTVHFGPDYYQTTISPELQVKIKGVIQAKGNEEKKKIERLKNFFYSMEFSDIQTLLFTKKWTKLEEDSQSDFLSKHEKLTELSEEELREAFERFSPRSDWERLFADKMDNQEIENMIEVVRATRNDIAHCKFFYKKQYLSFNETANALNRSIITAIRLTEEKDFTQKQAESFRIALAGITDTLAQLQKQIQETTYRNISVFVQSFYTKMSKWGEDLNANILKGFSEINFGRLENSINDELLTEEDELDNDENNEH